MPVNSNRAAVEARMDHAERAGLIAAAQPYRNAMIDTLKTGYTTGAFSQGFQGVAGSVAVSANTPDQVSEDADGKFVVVGTSARSEDGYPYPLGWELGHRNLFTRRYERVETWRPVLMLTAPEMIGAFQRTVRSMMGMETK